MGILDYILAGLGPEARKKLAKKAASETVRNVGDTVYRKADEVRERFEEAADARRAARDAEQAERRRDAERARAEQEIEDELAALKRRVRDE